MFNRFGSTLGGMALALCFLVVMGATPVYAQTTASKTAVIAAGQRISSSVPTAGSKLFGLVMPATWSAASITFQASFDGGTTWRDMYDSSGNEIGAVVAASRVIILDPVLFSSIALLRIRSGTSGAPVNQAGGRAIVLILRSI